MMFCPFDCEQCRDRFCAADGCQRNGARPLTPCGHCGRLHEAVTEPPLCRGCQNEHDAAGILAAGAPPLHH